MTSQKILIITEYLNAHFLLFLYALQVLEALFCAHFRKLCSVYSVPPCTLVAWHSGRTLVLAGELSLLHARPSADW